MKRHLLVSSFALCSVLLLGGCGMMEDNGSTMEQDTNNTTTKEPANNAETAVEDSMDNMMNYFKEQGIQLNNVQPIETMDFAAHEGKSFSYNGTTGYLYRLKSSDTNMKALLDDAKEKGVVKVNLEGQEQEYQAVVNGDYLLVFAQSGTMDDVANAMSSYQPGTFPNYDAALNNGTQPNPINSEPSQTDANGNTSME